MKVVLIALLALTMAAPGRQHETSEDVAQHRCAVRERGDRAMGFSHEKATHHFLLAKDGGAIEISANKPDDAETRDQVRRHLSQVAQMFSAGDFNVPMFIHNTLPPGSAVMTKLRAQIHYQFQETALGARIRMVTQNAQALKAIHDFLRFQIADHETGDPTEVFQGQHEK